MFLLGEISYGPRAMLHNPLHVTLYNVLYFYIPGSLFVAPSKLHLPPASHHHERPFVSPPWPSPLY